MSEPAAGADNGAPTVRVVVADDQDLVRTGLAMILDAQPDLDVVGVAADGRQAVAVAGRTAPDVVLMDVRMPVLDGVAATREILAARPATHVLVLTTFDLDEYVLGALRAGASGFLVKDAPRASLLAAVRAVATGDVLLSPDVTRRLVTTHLTRRVERSTEASRASLGLRRASWRCSGSSRPGDPTPSSPVSCTSPRRPSRPTWAACWTSSAHATACNSSSSPTAGG